MPWRIARVALAILAVSLAVAALVSRWSQLSGSAAHVSWGVLVGATLLACLALVPPFLSWRVFLADLGSPLPVRLAARPFFVAQLGKYVPGAVWPAVAQAELTKRFGIPARRSGTAVALTILASVASGGAVAALAIIARGSEGLHKYWWVIAIEPVLLCLAHPRVANALIDRAFRLARRPPLEHPVSGRATAVVSLWAMTAWLVNGVMTWVVARGVGATDANLFLLATGGYALAWTAGFLVFFAPAGAGVRELALTVVLAPAMSPASALLVALILRAVTTAADLLCAAAAELVHRRVVSRQATA
jgi:uncharacterized membrane protein YbhN (UPF0104 family)